MSEISDKIKGFISSELLYEDPGTELSEDTQLLGGTIDSLGLMQLISFLEEEFDVTIDDSEVTAENFRTIGDIEELVAEKASAG